MLFLAFFKLLGHSTHCFTHSVENGDADTDSMQFQRLVFSFQDQDSQLSLPEENEYIQNF